MCCSVLEPFYVSFPFRLSSVGGSVTEAHAEVIPALCQLGEFIITWIVLRGSLEEISQCCIRTQSHISHRDVSKEICNQNISGWDFGGTFMNLVLWSKGFFLSLH